MLDLVGLIHGVRLSTSAGHRSATLQGPVKSVKDPYGDHHIQSCPEEQSRQKQYNQRPK